MGRLAGFRYREIVRRLRANGFGFDRQAAGSHEIWFNEEHQAARNDDTDLGTRIKAYELAFKMQMAVPELSDVSKEAWTTRRAVCAVVGWHQHRRGRLGRP